MKRSGHWFSNSDWLQDGVIVTRHVADSAITTAKISDNQITKAKLVKPQQCRG